MTLDEFRAELARLGISQHSFAAYMDSNERTVRHWALGEQDIPSWLAVILRNARRPIDTVPDKTDIILGWNGEKADTAFRGGGRWIMTSLFMGRHPEPTHWMPRPEPPALTA
jgi:hypothetical protein